MSPGKAGLWLTGAPGVHFFQREEILSGLLLLQDHLQVSVRASRSSWSDSGSLELTLTCLRGPYHLPAPAALPVTTFLPG